MLIHRISSSVLAATLALAPAGCSFGERTTQPSSSANPVSGTASADDMARLIGVYQNDASDASRFYNVQWSETLFDRMAALYDQWEQRLASLQFNAADPQAAIDYILLRDHIRHEKSQLALDRRRLVEMSTFLPMRQDLQSLEFSRRRMEDQGAQAAAALLAKVPDSVKAARERADKARKPDFKPAEGSPALTPIVAQRAAGAVDDLARTIGRWATYHEGYQPEFAWWVKKPREEAAKALGDYAKFLREDVAGVKGQPEDPLLGDPIGAEALAGDLAAEEIAYSPAELIAIADRQFAWCETEMKKAAAEMGLSEDWKAALAKVKDDYAPPGTQDQYVRDLAREAIQFMKDHDLVTIPPLCEETWRIEMLSPDAQRSLPFAVYGGQHVGVAYPTDAMKHDDKMMSLRGNNRHFTRIVTPHELIPGHHLQGFLADREHPYRQMFSTPFLVEGWALHWEMELWDKNWAKSPQDRIGMLFWRMHRCARIIVSLKFHLGEMKPQEMIDFLVDRVGHEKFGATSEVRRFIGGSYSPLYQCGYMIGGLQIRALETDLVGSGKMTPRQFHDTLLTYGPIPIELIRAGMTNSPPPRDFKPQWRFAD